MQAQWLSKKPNIYELDVQGSHLGFRPKVIHVVYFTATIIRQLPHHRHICKRCLTQQTYVIPKFCKLSVWIDLDPSSLQFFPCFVSISSWLTRFSSPLLLYKNTWQACVGCQVVKPLAIWNQNILTVITKRNGEYHWIFFFVCIYHHGLKISVIRNSTHKYKYTRLLLNTCKVKRGFSFLVSWLDLIMITSWKLILNWNPEVHDFYHQVRIK